MLRDWAVAGETDTPPIARAKAVVEPLKVSAVNDLFNADDPPEAPLPTRYGRDV